MKIKEVKILDKIFDVSVFLKGFEGVLEIISGALLVYSVKTHQLVQFILKLTQHELAQDPTDFLANKFVEIAKNMSPGINFGMVYLLAHGLVKIFLSVMLLKKKLWAYPLAIYIFFSLALFLLIKFFNGFSLVYLLLAFFDLLIGTLTIWEYKRISKKLVV